MPNISEINGYLLNADTASYLLGSVTSASYALTASVVLGSITSASFSTTAASASTVNTQGVGTGTWYPLVKSTISTGYFTPGFANIFSWDYNTNTLTTTASWATNALTASLAPNYVLNSATSSFVLNSQTSSFVTNAQTSSFVQNSQTGSFATTGSNTFIGNQTITGSLIASSGSVGGTNTMITAQRSNGTKIFEAGQIAGNSVINIFDSAGNTINRIISNGSTYFASGSLNSVTIGSSGGSGKFNVRGDDASTSTNSAFINGNSVALMTILNNGNIGIGNSPAFNLDVSGSAIFRSQIIGPLTVSGTLIITGSISASAFNFVSSSLTQSRVLLDNTFDNTAISAAVPNSIRDRSPLLRIYGTYTTASAATNYTNQIISTYIYPTFNPTNNTAAVFNTLVLEPQFLNVNATGSARGLYVTPAFAGTHPNWRSIEWDNTEGYGLYGSGTARNYLNGSLGIGTLSPSASFHTTGSGIIVGSLALGTSSLGSTENTLVVGLPPAGGTGEGGQILLQASGGLYTSASMLDNYQNKFRVLRGTNVSSDAFRFQVDMQTGQVQIPTYNSTSAFTGSVVAGLGVDSNGNILTSTRTGKYGTALSGSTIGTGVTAQTIVYSQLIPANTFAAGNVIRTYFRFRKLATNGNATYNILVNTSAAVAGATTLATLTANTVHNHMKRDFYIAQGNATTTVGSGVSLNTDDTSNTQTLSTITWSSDQYLIYTVTLNTLDSGYGLGYTIEQVL